jgi:transcription-repair coupling factor (superfamily II helicase)
LFPLTQASKPFHLPSLKLQALLRDARVRAGFAREAKGVGVRTGGAAPKPASGYSAKAGLTPAAKALWIAGAASDDPRNELVLAVVPADRDVEQVTSDVRFFLGGLDGSSADELEAIVLPFPSQEVDPYRGLAPHLRIASTRARALHAMATGQARVVVASSSALLPRVSPPDVLTALALDLKPGDDIDTERLGETLVDAGFTRQDPVDEHGEFCIRGGEIDIFPAGDDLPARIELVGDTIEAIRRYAPDTQRSVASVERMKVVPLREILGSAFGTRSSGEVQPPNAGSETVLLASGPLVPFFDYLGIARQPIVVVSEPDEIRERIEKQLAQVAVSYEQAAAGRSRSGALPEPVGAYPAKAEASPKPVGLDPAKAGIPSPEAILIGWADIERQFAAAVALEELGLDDVTAEAGQREAPESPIPNPEPRAPSPESRVASQPALSFSGRLTDWINEVKAARARGEVVVFVAATPGRAERLIEVLDDYELRGVNIDRGEDSFAASVLVTTGVLSRGFRLPAAQLQLYAETDLFEEERRAQERVRRSAAKAFLSDLRDLKVGDLVVHVDNGIGEFLGLKQMTIGPNETLEFLELRYAGDDKLFVPVSRLDLIQKYSGGARPALDRLGGTTWEKAKSRVKKAMRDMAEELLKLYAARKAVTGHAFSPDTH